METATSGEVEAKIVAGTGVPGATEIGVVGKAGGDRVEEPLLRRGFLSRSGLMAIAGAAAPLWLPKSTARATTTAGVHQLVHIFLRGGCDGLSIVAPSADSFYTAQRQTPNGGPQLAIPQPAAGNGVTTLVDSVTGLRSWLLSAGAGAASSMVQNHDLAFVHGVGSPVENNGSHFFSQDYMEDGTQVSPILVSDGRGWAGRAMDLGISTDLWRGMGYGTILQRTLFGAPATIAIPDPPNFNLNGNGVSLAKRKLALEYLFNVSDEPLKSAAANSLKTLAQIQAANIAQYTPGTGYPVNSHFAEQLKVTQSLIRACTGTAPQLALETIMIDYGGWDDHNDMGPTPNTTANPSSENMHKRVADLFGSLKAFYDDLQGTGANYTVVITTEFGRRITANATAGVDHGRGSLMIVMGTGVNGGKVFTMQPPSAGTEGTTPGWNGLQAHSVLQVGATSSHNLLPTIDYRRVLGEILQKRLGLTQQQVRACFPGFDYGTAPYTPIGVLL